MIGTLVSSWSHFIICRLVEIRKSSASMMPTCLAPRNRSKDFLASASLPLDINQAGDSGQNKIITKQIIGMITVDPMAYLQDNTAPEKHKHQKSGFYFLYSVKSSIFCEIGVNDGHERLYTICMFD